MFAREENWIGQLPPTVQAAILERMTPIDFAPGEEICRAGSPALRMHQVERGHVKLAGLHEDGRQSFIAIYVKGNCFSESAIVSRRDFHHTTLALTQTRIRVLTQSDFWDLYHRHPEIPDALCRKFAGTLSLQMAASEMRANHRLGKRIALMFENLAAHCAEIRTGDSATIALPFTQADIGDHFDVTRQSIQREITALKAMGILDKYLGRWVIRDLGKLARI